MVAGVWIGGLARGHRRTAGSERRGHGDNAMGVASGVRFAWILVREWVPQILGEWIVGTGAGRTAFLAMTVVVFVLIGALLEGLPALLIFGPILFPISRAVGLDPVHYGVVIVAAMGIAFFLPPIGVGLSIAAGVGRVDLDDVAGLSALFWACSRAWRSSRRSRGSLWCCRDSYSDIEGDPRSQRPFEVRSEKRSRSGSERHLRSGVKCACGPGSGSGSAGSWT